MIHVTWPLVLSAPGNFFQFLKYENLFPTSEPLPVLLFCQDPYLPTLSPIYIWKTGVSSSRKPSLPLQRPPWVPEVPGFLCHSTDPSGCHGMHMSASCKLNGSSFLGTVRSTLYILILYCIE